ncbi:MAG TPA: dipeptide ABC transporter ATP-binding protein [Thiotrichales bacterium]|nr:dipeptide ABC transporter ATP-binding protein [Thiotrichales bacterium]
MTEPLLSVRDLQVHFSVLPQGGLFRKARTLRAVDGVSFDLQPGETLGVVGESGCGKSTLARGILGLVPPAGGSVRLKGEELVGLSRREMRDRRRLMQMIFQDPLASLDPRMTVGQIIAEPLQTFEPRLGREARRQKVQEMMERVGLLPNQINRYPHEFSGGQCQRIGIARALIVRPELIICDEPVSALDVSIQAQVVNLLMDLQREFGVALIFIAHDLSVVEHISHRVMVMYLGRVAELSDSDTLYQHPRHPYTRALIDAVPIPDPAIERAKREVSLRGDLPSPLDPPSGCAFRTRCPKAHPRCADEVPILRELEPGRWVACHTPD